MQKQEILNLEASLREESLRQVQDDKKWIELLGTHTNGRARKYFLQ